MNTALISAYHKSDALADFAGALKKRRWNILASAGTKKFFDERGIESTDVATIIGEPILGHRVVTLSREIHAGLLARPEDGDELARLGITRIDLVYVDLYPLEEEIAKPAATEATVIEKTDIGGPTTLRSAAKGRRVTLSKPEQFDAALAYFDRGQPDRKYLASLAAEAEELVAAYCSASARYCRTISD